MTNFQWFFFFSPWLSLGQKSLINGTCLMHKTANTYWHIKTIQFFFSFHLLGICPDTGTVLNTYIRWCLTVLSIKLQNLGWFRKAFVFHSLYMYVFSLIQYVFPLLSLYFLWPIYTGIFSVPCMCHFPFQ